MLTRRQFVKSVATAAAANLLAPALWAAGCSSNNTTKTKKSMTTFTPAYLALHQSGELRRRADALWQRLRACDICPRKCGVNRLEGNPGFCRASADLVIASFGPHFGEEPPLVGRGGSGTIFFCHCSLRCVFCINYDISHGGNGRIRSIDDLANMMLALQRQGCHNINVVTPTHYSPHILLALDKAAAKGLRLPVVYNTCGWENLDVLQLLDGIVDIYLPDFKYADNDMARKHLGGARNYAETVQTALLEMHRQVGTLQVGPDGIARRGLMIRHLVMPNDVAKTKLIVEWIAKNLPKDTYVNIMSQYMPVFRAKEFPEIARRITRAEYAQAIAWARAAGLTRIETQPMPL